MYSKLEAAKALVSLKHTKRKKIKSKSHFILGVLNNSARVLFAQKRMQDCYKICKILLKKKKKILGLHHIETKKTQNDLSLVEQYIFAKNCKSL